MSLRWRLVAGLLAVSIVGLALTGAATVLLQRSFLLDRLDDQLEASLVPARLVLAAENDPGTDDGTAERARRALPAGMYAEIRNADGSVRVRASYSLTGDPDDRPMLPTARPDSILDGSPERFDVSGTTGGRYRVLTAALPRGGTLVVALPLDDVRDTLGRLVRVEILVAAGVLALICAGSWRLAGVGLRPLSAIADTAGSIAAGHLDRRVPEPDERTEIGQLGISINTMLERIEQAMRARLESEDRLRRFLSDASHELRTPLTSIRGYAELFRRGADVRTDDLAMAMRRIESEAERMGRLVDDLLQLARLDEEPHPERRPVDLAELAADAARDAHATQPTRPLAVVVDSDVGAVVLGDDAQLRRAIGNLVTNAIVHTPVDTAVEIRVGVDEDGVRLEVRDDGPGMHEGATAHVFERFQAGHRNSERGSTGLGLAIVRAVAEAHGGTVDVRTAPGSGCVFTFRLPSEDPRFSVRRPGCR